MTWETTYIDEETPKAKQPLLRTVIPIALTVVFGGLAGIVITMIAFKFLVIPSIIEQTRAEMPTPVSIPSETPVEIATEESQPYTIYSAPLESGMAMVVIVFDSPIEITEAHLITQTGTPSPNLVVPGERNILVFMVSDEQSPAEIVIQTPTETLTLSVP
jgi:hypothetical protein